MEKKSPKERMIMALGDEALDGVTGGTAGNGSGVPTCPLCSSPAAKYICENLQCRNYGSYIIPYAKIPKQYGEKSKAVSGACAPLMLYTKEVQWKKSLRGESRAFIMW